MMLCLVATALVGATSKSSGPKVGDLAPPFELTLVDRSHVTLEQLRGNVVVLNLWATWCVPCRKELPMLDHYYDVRGKYGLRMFVVQTEDDVPEYKMKKLFKILKIPAVVHMKGPYGTLEGVPTNYIFDRSGHLRYAKAAAFDIESLNAVLAPLLAEPRPADAPPAPPLPPPPGAAN
jgi:thiol-disulfide isomerase/thioredoxin